MIVYLNANNYSDTYNSNSEKDFSYFFNYIKSQNVSNLAAFSFFDENIQYIIRKPIKEAVVRWVFPILNFN